MAELTLQQQQAIAIANARRRAAEAGGEKEEPETTPYAGIPAPIQQPGTAPSGSFEATNAPLGAQLRLAAGFLLNMQPEARKDMVRNVLGDEAKITQDEDGNDIVEYRGERSYLNKPGIDLRDMTQFAFDMVKFAPAARFAQWAGKAKQAGAAFSSIRAALVGAPAAAGTEALSQAASKPFGSEQDIDGTAVALAGGGAAAGELILGRLRTFLPEAKRLMSSASKQGIGLRSPPGRQVYDVGRAVNRLVPEERGAAFPELAEGVQAARKAEDTRIGAIFKSAREKNVGIPREKVAELAATARKTMAEKWDLKDMPTLARRVRELQLLGRGSQATDINAPLPEQSLSRRLNDLEKWRERLNRHMPGPNDTQRAAERAAHVELKKMYTDFRAGLFNDDMISGDPTAINEWKTAIKEWAKFKDTFDANAVIRNLANKEATQEQMSQWLLSANAVNGQKPAALVIERLNNILGKNSPQMVNLRKEVILDIAEPMLLRDPPNLHAFVRNFDKWFSKNPSLRKNLFPDGMGEFEDVIRLARGISKRPGTVLEHSTNKEGIGSRILTSIARLGVGHGIAKGGVKVQVTSGVLNWMRVHAIGPLARRNILREALGMEPRAPMFPNSTAIGAAGVPPMFDDDGEQ